MSFMLVSGGQVTVMVVVGKHFTFLLIVVFSGKSPLSC